ncbi:MAG: DUF4190 domain-containing protein [Clostridiales bacterium]|nr:DUF4190 domain-containing protein [Clostridiales bacterium]
MSEVQTTSGNNGKTLAIVSMVLGILSVVSSYGPFIGVIMAIVGLILNGKAKAAGNQSVFLKVGKITSIVGLILGVILGILWLVFVVFMAAAGTTVDYANGTFAN